MPVPALLGARAATLPEALPPAAYIPGRNLLRLVSQLAQVVGLGLGGLLLVVFPEALANPYAAERAMTTAELGLLMASAPLGSLVGEFLGIRVLSPARQVRMIASLAVLSLAPLLGYALRPGFAPAALLLFLAGTGIVHHLGQDRHLLQVAPEHLRSRALALRTTGLMFFQGLGFAAAGAAGEFFRISTVVPAAALLGLAAVAVLRPSRQGPVSAASTL